MALTQREAETAEAFLHFRKQVQIKLAGFQPISKEIQYRNEADWALANLFWWWKPATNPPRNQGSHLTTLAGRNGHPIPEEVLPR